MNRAEYWSVLVLLLVSASACTEDPGGETIAGSSQTDTVVSILISETFGNMWQLGAPTIAFDDPIQEVDTGGRLLTLVQVGLNTWKFQFHTTDSTMKCMAVNNSGNLVEVRACSVDSATWIVSRGPSSGSCLFQNINDVNTNNGYLSGPNGNTPGGQFQLQPRGKTGWLQQFIAGNICN